MTTELVHVPAATHYRAAAPAPAPHGRLGRWLHRRSQTATLQASLASSQRFGQLAAAQRDGLADAIDRLRRDAKTTITRLEAALAHAEGMQEQWRQTAVEAQNRWGDLDEPTEEQRTVRSWESLSEVVFAEALSGLEGANAIHGLSTTDHVAPVLRLVDELLKAAESQLQRQPAAAARGPWDDLPGLVDQIATALPGLKKIAATQPGNEAPREDVLELRCSWLLDPLVEPALWGEDGWLHEVQLFNHGGMVGWVEVHPRVGGYEARYPIPNRQWGDSRICHSGAHSHVMHQSLDDALAKAAAYLLHTRGPDFPQGAWLTALPAAGEKAVPAETIAWPEHPATPTGVLPTHAESEIGRR